MLLTACEQTASISQNECIALVEGITDIPFKRGMPAPGTYYQMLEKRDERAVAECLLSQITNRTPTDDPRKSIPGPVPQLSLGDVSVFMLTDMYDIPFTTFLSNERWEHMGVFEYYKFIQQKNAHEKIQAVLAPIVESKFE